jgi:HSP20 family protein
MTMIRLNPVWGMQNMMREMDNMVQNISQKNRTRMQFGDFRPRIDIAEDEKTLFIYAEVPGMSKNDVKVSVNEERVLTLKGEKKRAEKKEELSYLRNERFFGEFERSFMLPDNVDIEKIQAKYENGVLELVLPKMEPAKPKEINVEVN